MAFRKFTPRWTLVNDDVRMTSFYFNTGGNADEEDTIEAAFDVFWNSINARYDNNTVLDEYRWYFSAALVPRGSPWGEADRVIDRNIPGDRFSDQLPPQLSIVMSYLRPSPTKRHHGRNYLPSPAATALDADGRIATDFVNLIADQAEIFFEACVAAGYQPVTIARVGGSDVALIIPTVDVDNVFDTQRRRGYDDYTFRATRELTTVP